ncbi:cystathionine beta-synthase [Kwoniella mangroviensis CBS 8886]|nr:cystathionine beta-synthase [Kwoniella mangroviensis CBS 8507]OCF64239.1 cystathionine beta-synthase [Kwoniella mangroviensis CBS 8507]OCF78594.1 cystathionine beta-synthase [Kwoniella mangroviensis CBS 8886]
MSGETQPQHHWQGVLSSALDAVGHTPLVRLQRIAKEEGLNCNLLGKCEFFSAGGSVKDRIANRMVEQAEKKGVLIPGQSIIIEPTSGNTGIGLALACAIKGYQCIITLPAKMSLEKEVMLRALGAEIVRTPTEAAWDSSESHIGVARKLQKSIPGGVILDQYSNPHNPLAHYYGTYEEIMHSLKTSDLPRKDISLLVAGAGTGGTITGLGRAIRDYEASLPHTNGNSASHGRTTIIAVDPEGSILGGGEPGNYQVEGIGYDFFPEVLDPNPPVVDKWLKTNDEEAFDATKRLIRKEGLFVGGSSGSALSGTLRYLHSEEGKHIAEDPNANVVVILPDGVRNYMSKSWFLETSKLPTGENMEEKEDIKSTIRGILGRDLNDVMSVVDSKREKGEKLENGD